MQSTNKWGIDETLIVMLEAALAAGNIIKEDFASLKKVSGEDKKDGSSVTDTDKRSQKAAIVILSKIKMPIWSEETNKTLAHLLGTTAMFLVDPLDGTSFWLVARGGDTTVIIATVDQYGAVDRCVVYEVLIGRLLFAHRGDGTWAFTVTGDLSADLNRAVRCQVTAVMKKPTVAWDRTWRFKPPHKVILDDQLDVLAISLGAHYKLMYGPNGINHALVAWGGDGMLASIMVARGGPWDAAAVLLVLESGGFARGFDENGEEVSNPLEVGNITALVTAANEETLVQVSGFVHKAMKTAA